MSLKVLLSWRKKSVVVSSGKKGCSLLNKRKRFKNALYKSNPENEGIASSLWGNLNTGIHKAASWDYHALLYNKRLFKHWSFYCQCQARKNYKRYEKKVREFKEKTYTAIVQKANDENVEILFVDETGINNQEYRVRGYSSIGCSPTVGSVSKTETCRHMC